MTRPHSHPARAAPKPVPRKPTFCEPTPYKPTPCKPTSCKPIPYKPRSFCLSVVCTLLLAGCGDVRGEAQGAHTLRIDGRGASYLGVQDGLGAWQVAPTAGGDLRVTLTDPRGRYGVLSVCAGEPNGNLSVNVQHGVVAETPLVTANCLASEGLPAPTVGVAGVVTGLANGEYGNVYLGEASALFDSAAPEGRLELPAARYDLIASKYGGAERVPNRLVFEPDLEVAADGLLAVDFRGPFAFTPEVAQLGLAGVRPGELLSGSVELVTPGGTTALLGEYTGGVTLPYARVPGRLLRGSRLRAEAQSFTYDDRTKAGSSRSVSLVLSAPSLTLPAPLALPRLELRGGAAVRPRARWDAYGSGSGLYVQFYSQIRSGRALSYRLSQSAAWLADGPLVYTLPELYTLPEWQRSWNLTRGADLFWDVSFSQETPLQRLFVSRSGVVTP